MKRQFFDTGFATFAGLTSQIPRVLRYAIENRNSIFSTSELMQLALSTRNILKTPMASVFERLVSSEKLENFAAIYPNEKGSSIPELLTASNITLDLKQVPDPTLLKSFPELRNKVLINMTGFLRPDRSTGGYTVNAVDLFQNTVVRGHLVASYQDSDGWLTPYLAEYAVKSYSMILSGLISRYYSLTLVETMKVQGVLALFMCQLFSRETDSLVFPPLFNKCTYIGSHTELQELADECESFTKNGLTVNTLCELIAHVGPDRMKAFDQASFKALCGNLGPDILTSQISLEYPPYWVFIMLLALSGAKLPLIFQMNAQKLTQEGRSKFLHQMLVSDILYDVTRR